MGGQPTFVLLSPNDGDHQTAHCEALVVTEFAEHVTPNNRTLSPPSLFIITEGPPTGCHPLVPDIPKMSMLAVDELKGA